MFVAAFNEFWRSHARGEDEGAKGKSDGAKDRDERDGGDQAGGGAEEGGDEAQAHGSRKGNGESERACGTYAEGDAARSADDPLGGLDQCIVLTEVALFTDFIDGFAGQVARAADDGARDRIHGKKHCD